MKRQRDTDINYIFQTDDYCSYQCGPISIHNALRKKGRYTSLRSLIKMCVAHPKHGTSIENMSKTLESVNKIHNINIELLDPAFNNVMNSIKADKKIIILYHWRTSCKSDEHYALIDGVHDNKIKIINYAIDVPIGYISMRELKTMLMPFKRDNGDIVPKVWIIN